MVAPYSKLGRSFVAEVGDYWIIANKVYDATASGHAEIIKEYLESSPDIDLDELESMYNSDHRFRTYALTVLDGIRIASDQVEVHDLTPTKLRKIRRFFVDEYGDDAFSQKIGIQVNASKTYYAGIPLEEIDEDLPRKISRYKMYSGKKADFSGDFQNVYDLRPDPGNTCPGRNREYVKQQVDWFPHKVSGDSDEFVHTHPENCPRPDLRKLKIADPDKSESEFSESPRD